MYRELSFQLMFLAIFAVANNFKSLGKFIEITNGLNRYEQLKLSLSATLASFMIMLVALIFGESVLRFFGLSLDTFRIAGGIVLAILGVDMIHAKKSVDEHELDITHNYSTVISTAIIPIAIPLTTGAGTFSTIIILADAVGKNYFLYFQLVGAIILQTFLIFIVFRYSSGILRVLGRTGMSVLIRIVGLFTLTLGVQFITIGLKAIFPGWGI